MSDKIARKRAELAMLEAEEEFVQKKLAGELTQEDKQALRELRQEYRLTMRSKPAGGGVAVETVGAESETPEANVTVEGSATPTVEEN